MIKVQIRKRDKRLTIPVPYSILSLFSSILTSKLVLKWANHAIGKSGNSMKVPQLKKKDIQPLLKALLEQRGLKLVDTKLVDGTEISVTL